MSARNILALLSITALAAFMAGLPAHAQPTLAEASIAATSDTLVVNEVRTSGPGNSQFTELRNIDDQTLDISGWQLSRCGSTGQPLLVTTFPGPPGSQTTVLQPKGQVGQYLLIAPTATVAGPTGHVATDVQVSTSWTTDGGWQVADQFGVVVDGVGFGNNGCTETQAAPDCSTSGLAATRDTNGTDTDNNSADFTCATATPMNSLS